MKKIIHQALYSLTFALILPVTSWTTVIYEDIIQPPTEKSLWDLYCQKIISADHLLQTGRVSYGKIIQDEQDEDDVTEIEQNSTEDELENGILRVNLSSLEITSIAGFNTQAIKQVFVNLFICHIPDTISIADFTITDIPHIALDLSKNAIYKIPEDIFFETHLKKLSLSHNQLSELPTKIFFLRSSLDTLNLSHNRLITINANVFMWLSGLDALDISNNEIETLDEKLLQAMEHLTTFDCHNNPISYIPEHFFDNLFWLHYVTLPIQVHDEEDPQFHQTLQALETLKTNNPEITICYK